MISKVLVRPALVALLLLVFAASLSAQRVEIYPNAGYMWADTMNNGQRFKSDAVVGMKTGVFVGPHGQIEGSFGYLNHFELRQPPNPFNPAFGVVQPTVHGFMYDLNTNYNFGERQFLNSRIAPFLSVGAGGLTAHIRNSSMNPTTFIEGGGNIIDATGAIVPNPGRSKVLSSGDTFLTFNYGGGIKFLNVAGPMGFRFDVRGRTLPNFFGETTTWFEPSAGITFSWGER